MPIYGILLFNGLRQNNFFLIYVCALYSIYFYATIYWKHAFTELNC